MDFSKQWQKRSFLRSSFTAVEISATRAQELSHISPVMSIPLPVGSCQWLHVQPRVSLQTTGVAAWLSPGISRVALIGHWNTGSAHFHHCVHHEWLMKGLFEPKHVWSNILFRGPSWDGLYMEKLRYVTGWARGQADAGSLFHVCGVNLLTYFL